MSLSKLSQVQDTHQGLQDASVKLLLQLLTQWRLALQLQGKMRGGVEVCTAQSKVETVGRTASHISANFFPWCISPNMTSSISQRSLLILVNLSSLSISQAPGCRSEALTAQCSMRLKAWLCCSSALVRSARGSWPWAC